MQGWKKAAGYCPKNPFFWFLTKSQVQALYIHHTHINIKSNNIKFFPYRKQSKTMMYRKIIIFYVRLLICHLFTGIEDMRNKSFIFSKDVSKRAAYYAFRHFRLWNVDLSYSPHTTSCLIYVWICFSLTVSRSFLSFLGMLVKMFPQTPFVRTRVAGMTVLQTEELQHKTTVSYAYKLAIH